jgi:putative SOS response-associated peptidase YedK
MCGRFTLNQTNPTRLRARFDLPESVELNEQPRFNIAPTDPVLAIRRGSDGIREAGRLRWGLLPGRWADQRSGAPLINARAETIAEQPAFRDAFRERRCLVPADGFYEWRTDGNGKRPVWISRADGELWAFAGIWAALERGEAEAVHSCAIVTCEPNELMRPIHDRMPVILAPEMEAAWLDPGMGADELAELLAPLPEDLLEVREVSDAVNDVRQDGPHLLEPPLRLF